MGGQATLDRRAESEIRVNERQFALHRSQVPGEEGSVYACDFIDLKNDVEIKADFDPKKPHRRNLESYR